MIVLIDTSAPICHLNLIIDGTDNYHEWEAGRSLAKGLLKYLRDTMAIYGKSWSDIKGIGVFEGPGSFTGLRIGMAVVNTIANSENIPIVGARGEAWRDEATRKLIGGQDQKIILPFYGAEANITTPKK